MLHQSRCLLQHSLAEMTTMCTQYLCMKYQLCHNDEVDNLYTCRLYTAFCDMCDDSSLDDDSALQELYSLGQQYINGALTLCGNNALASIWGEQDTAFQQESSSHEVKIWAAPAVTADSQAEAQQGDSYNTVADQQMADFVTSVQASAASCCVPGIDVQVSCCRRITSAALTAASLSAYQGT